MLQKTNVSKRHVKIVWKNQQFTVIDLRSTNGTFVNGKRITVPTTVGVDDLVHVGDYTINVALVDGSHNLLAPSITDSITFTVPDPPLFNIQPHHQIVDTGSNVTLDTNATGNATGVVVYQWYRNGAAISGANNATYSIIGYSEADHMGRYTVEATNAIGNATSEGAVLATRVAMTGMPELVALLITNIGGNHASYIYRLLAEYYHQEDTDLR